MPIFHDMPDEWGEGDGCLIVATQTERDRASTEKTNSIQIKINSYSSSSSPCPIKKSKQGFHCQHIDNGERDYRQVDWRYRSTLQHLFPPPPVYLYAMEVRQYQT